MNVVPAEMNAWPRSHRSDFTHAARHIPLDVWDPK